MIIQGTGDQRHIKFRITCSTGIQSIQGGPLKANFYGMLGDLTLLLITFWRLDEIFDTKMETGLIHLNATSHFYDTHFLLYTEIWELFVLGDFFYKPTHFLIKQSQCLISIMRTFQALKWQASQLRFRQKTFKWETWPYFSLPFEPNWDFLFCLWQPSALDSWDFCV